VATTVTEAGIRSHAERGAGAAQRAARDFGDRKGSFRARPRSTTRARSRPSSFARWVRLLHGTYVPEQYGGSGLDALSYVLIVEEINRAVRVDGVVLLLGTSRSRSTRSSHQRPAHAQKEKLPCRSSRAASGSAASLLWSRLGQ